ncbi:12053_t:CDS:10 [Dentiscutata erythropus]|uniref:12053_t:CDS:1 n=1 Tax=Dentiscutata erythropus TaxID=1348616 RepID=A0A9N9A244_9GLOM|nr:12053_t:CDS:10 [Dentiscutata erythropus]
MAFSEIHNETLRSALWIPIQVNSVPNNDRTETYLAKAIFTDQSYLVLVTNLRYVWFEELFADEITKKFQESQSFFSPIFEMKVTLDHGRLPEYMQFLSEYLLPQRSDVTHKISLQNDNLLLESKRNVGPMELTWSFSCKLIPTSSPKKTSNPDSDKFVDSATVLYTHFILPHLLVTSAYNQQIEMLHSYIKSKEERFSETVRLMSLMRLETPGKTDKSSDNTSPSFDPEKSYEEIEQIIQDCNVSENNATLNVCNYPTFSRLFRTATERVIPQKDKFPSTSVLPENLSYSSSAPTFSAFENLPVSQLATLKLPSLSDTQLTKLFTPYNDPAFPNSPDDPLYVSQNTKANDADEIEILSPSVFTSQVKSRVHNNPEGLPRDVGKSKVSNDKLDLAQQERELEKRRQLKEMAAKQEKTTKKQQKELNEMDSFPKNSSLPTSFEQLGLNSWLIDALNAMSIKFPTEIQSACIPKILLGKDCIGEAKTGSGKTAAFALPILQKLSEDPFGIFALVLTPTSKIRFLVLDEADRLLSDTFADDLNVIFDNIPSKRQTLLFTATMTENILALENLEEDPGKRPFVYQIKSDTSTVSTLAQYYIFIPSHVREPYLVHLLRSEQFLNQSTIIFCGRCKTAELLRVMLVELDIRCTSLHSSMSQKERLNSLGKFKAEVVKVLIATDVGSRGGVALSIVTERDIDLVHNIEARTSK